MDLKGAEIRDVFNLCKGMNSNNNVPLSVKIPFYQRPYRWGNEQIKNLINDFQNNRRNNIDDGYFIGSVVLVEHERDRDVIDGQQRITTVFLLGYLYFLIQRARIQELISRRRSNLIDKLQDLKNIYSKIIGNRHVKNFEEMIETINNCMEEIDDDNREDKYDEIEEIYCNCVGLPVEKNLSKIEDYLSTYINRQEQFLYQEKMGVSYSRDSYNNDLKEALKTICVTVSKDNGIKIYIKDRELEDDIEPFFDKDKTINPNVSQYLRAICYGYKNIMGFISTEKDNLKYTENILRLMKDILENLKFCVIITGNEKDAYTLFEVLNDRALAIDDLELIKNLFYKAYCLNSGDSDFTIDKNIKIMDDLWGDNIFKRDLAETTRKNISFWGTVYLTGDTEITSKQVAKYREPLDSKYLSSYNRKDNLYRFVDAWNDITIYHMIGVLIEKFNIRVRKTAEECIKAENDTHKSSVYKTIHFLNALGQTSIIAAILNFIIKYYLEEIKDKNEIKIQIKKFDQFLDELKEESNKYKYNNINVLAHKLWQASMLSDSYKAAREYACTIIKKVNKSRYDININQLISNTDIQILHNEFLNWTSRQCYGKGDRELKLKILFIRLIRTKKSNNTLTFTPSQYNFTTDALQLDHLEAQKMDSSNKNAFFEPENSGVLRETYINGLGNLMLLDSTNNNNKNNKPLYLSMQYYSNLCSDSCWLVDEIKQMLSEDQYSTLIKGSNQRKPKEEFFIERGKRLREYFYKIIETDLNQTEITLK